MENVLHTNLDIELLELLQVQPAGGAVLQKAFVPLLQLVFIKLCVLHQILHHLGSQLAVLLSHGSCGARACEYWVYLSFSGGALKTSTTTQKAVFLLSPSNTRTQSKFVAGFFFGTPANISLALVFYFCPVSLFVPACGPGSTDLDHHCHSRSSSSNVRSLLSSFHCKYCPIVWQRQQSLPGFKKALLQ